MIRKSGMVGLLAGALLGGPAMGATVFMDDFESGNLNQWTGQGGGATSAQIVVDPLDATNHALSFAEVKIGGDAFSSVPFDVPTTDVSYLSFDYLGLNAAADAGGFAGYSQATPGDHYWMAGTIPLYLNGGNTQLVNDGQWHSYVIPFTSKYSSIRVMLEDFAYASTVAGDAYFDNVKVAAVPLPSAALGGLGLLGALVALRRTKA